MFSHVLVAYQAALLDYATKSFSTYDAAVKILSEKTHYNFTILKDLTQVPVIKDGDVAASNDLTPLDSDQMLFFMVNCQKSLFRFLSLDSPAFSILFSYQQEEFEDNNDTNKGTTIAKSVEPTSSGAATSDAVEKEPKPTAAVSLTDSSTESNVCDLLGLSFNKEKPTGKSESDCLLDWFDEIETSTLHLLPSHSTASAPPVTDSTFDLLKKVQGTATTTTVDKGKSKPVNKSNGNEKKNSAWMDLFADLDPLANPAMMEKKISGPNQNCLDA